MKMTWKKKEITNKGSKRPIHHIPYLPFGEDIDEITKDQNEIERITSSFPNDVDDTSSVSVSAAGDAKLAQVFEEKGTKLAEGGEFHEALVKWEAALILHPERAVLHEQKAQVLLELGEAWKALNDATRATELEPYFAEAWITLGRAQLNFGESDSVVMSFDRALAIKPDSIEASDDKQTAMLLLKKRKQLQST